MKNWKNYLLIKFIDDDKYFSSHRAVSLIICTLRQLFDIRHALIKLKIVNQRKFRITMKTGSKC